MAEFNRTREALRASMTAWAVAEVRQNQARVTVVPDSSVLAMHLERVDPEWSLSWGCDSIEPPVIRARLSIAGATREGIATGHTLEDARLRALADAARFFGVVTVGEAQWVEYDPEDGANTTDLSSEVEQHPIAPSTLPAENVRDPQLEKARRHIEDLVDQLKAAGKSGEATRILLRGYGETLEESRQIYKELQHILKGQG